MTGAGVAGVVPAFGLSVAVWLPPVEPLTRTAPTASRISTEMPPASQPGNLFTSLQSFPISSDVFTATGSFGLDGGLPSNYLTKRTDRGIVETLPG